jgi:ABC-type branched-subunit amino acid transport system substrate-binding protein
MALVAAACGNAKSNNGATASTSPGATAATIDQSSLTVNHPITETGVTDKEIRVSVVASITNPLGENYQAFADGINAYFAMVNQNNGLYGRQLKVAAVHDDMLSNNQAQVQKALSQDNPFAVFVATSLFTGANTLAAAQVPTFGWYINTEWANHPTFFQNGAVRCFSCADPMVPWIAQHVGAKNVGVISYNVPQAADCANGDEASFKKWPTAKIALIDKTLSFGVTDMSAQVAQMKQKGVDLVTTCLDLNGAFTLAKEMKTQGLKATLILPNSYDRAFIMANKAYFQGAYDTAQFTPLEATPQIPEQQLFQQWMANTHKPIAELSVQGWIAANQFVTGLKLAGPDFSRAKLVAALNSQKEISAHGFIAPINWSTGHTPPDKRPATASDGLDCWPWVQINNGVFEPAFGSPGKPWVCFTNASVRWGDPTPSAVPQVTAYSFENTGP